MIDRPSFGCGGARVYARQLEDECARGFAASVEIKRELRSRGVFEEWDAVVPDVFARV